MISKLLKIIGLFCRIQSLLWGFLQKRPIIIRSLLIEATPKHLANKRLKRRIKLQVSFAKEPCKRDDILQKRPTILSILLTVATPQAVSVGLFVCAQFSFAKEPYKRDDILQKRPIILSILLTVATPQAVSVGLFVCAQVSFVLGKVFVYSVLVEV